MEKKENTGMVIGNNTFASGQLAECLNVSRVGFCQLLLTRTNGFLRRRNEVKIEYRLRLIFGTQLD